MGEFFTKRKYVRHQNVVRPPQKQIDIVCQLDRLKDLYLEPATEEEEVPEWKEEHK